MTSAVYRQAFEQAKTDLKDAIERHQMAEMEAAHAEIEIIQLRRSVVALATLCGEDVEDSIGLTEAVRMFFKMRHAWTTLKELKDNIEGLGVSLADLKNPDASVMSVLARLVAANELTPGVRKGAGPGATDIKVWRPVDKEPAIEPLEDDDIPF